MEENTQNTVTKENKNMSEENNKTSKKSWPMRIVTNPLLLSFVAFAILCVIGYSSLQKWLNKYTQHGIEIEVPDLNGLNEKEAREILEIKGMTYEIIDSTFIRGKKPGTVVDQVPAIGSRVKSGRKIYLTIQACQAKKVAIPEVREASARQAEATLKSIGLSVSDLEYVPSEQSGNVIEVKYRDRTVLPGDMIVEGSQVVLVIGRGLTNEEAVVPSFRSMKLQSAKNLAHERSLNIGEIVYDEKAMSDAAKETAIVYKQDPITGKSVVAGTRVKIFMTCNKNKLDEPEEVFQNDAVTDSVAGTQDGLWE